MEEDNAQENNYPMSAPNIVLCYPVEQKHIEQIAAAMPAANVIDAGQERIAEELLNADIFCGHAKVPVPWDKVVQQGRLKWIQSSAAGMDHCLVPEVIESDIIVTSASGVLADQVAEQTMALLMGILRSIPTFLKAQAKKEFIRRPTHDLHHSTVGIVGFGGNGRRLAEVLQPFKTKIVATDLFPVNKPDSVTELLPADELPTLLKQSDIVIVTAPLNEETHGMFNRDCFKLMKQHSVLINVARGPLVVEDDLVEALTDGPLLGAGVDVTEVEPLPESSRLWDLPNVIITPHVGGQSSRRIDNMTQFFCDNLKRYQTNAPLRNFLTDKRLGFPIPTTE